MPALVEAHIGIAMGSGTDVARESAVMLLGNDLLKFVETLKVAQRSHRIIMANFAGTLIVDGASVAFGGIWFFESSARRVHSRLIRTGVHPQLGALAPGTVAVGHNVVEADGSSSGFEYGRLMDSQWVRDYLECQHTKAEL